MAGTVRGPVKRVSKSFAETLEEMKRANQLDLQFTDLTGYAAIFLKENERGFLQKLPETRKKKNREPSWY